VGLDTGFYRAGLLYHDGRGSPRDAHPVTIRTLNASDLEGFDAVVHLAELSNDPLCQHDPKKTYEINHLGSVAARQGGKKRRAFPASSTPLPAVSTAPAADGPCETRTPSPIRRPPTRDCKMLVERDVRAFGG